MYRIVPSDTPKERKRRAKGEREGERAKPKMEFSTRKGKRRWGKFSPSSPPPPPPPRLLPILFLYSTSRLATPYFLGRKLFTSFRLVLSSSLYVRCSVRRPSVRPSVRPTHRVARHQSHTATKRVAQLNQSRNGRGGGGQGKGRGLLAWHKKMHGLHILLPSRMDIGRRMWRGLRGDGSYPRRRSPSQIDEEYLLTYHWR